MYWVAHLRHGAQRIYSRFALPCALSLLAIGASPFAQAQLPGLPKPKSNQSSSNEVPSEPKVTLEIVEERLAKVRAELKAEPTGPNENSLRRTLLQRLERLHEQELNHISELSATKIRREEMAREAATWRDFPDPKPFSIFLTDRLREAIQVERMEIARGELALTTLRRLHEDHQTSLKQSEEKIRQLNDQLENGKDPGEKNRERDIERLMSRVAFVSMEAVDFERQVRTEQIAVSRVRLGLAERKLVVANQFVAFTEADLEKARENFKSQQEESGLEIKSLESRHSAATKALEEALDELRQAESQTSTNLPLVTEKQELVELRRAQLDTADAGLKAIGFMHQASELGQVIWEARFSAFRSHDSKTLRWTERRLAGFRSRIDLWKSYYVDQLENASGRIALQEARVKKMEASSELAALARQRLDALLERDQLLLRVTREIQRGDNLVARMEEELREASGNLPFWGRMRNVASEAGSLLERLWNFELFAAKDTIVVEGQSVTGKRSVTFGKVFSVILIFVGGFWFTSILSRLIQPLIVRRYKIDWNQAKLIRRWVRVGVTVVLILISLAIVKIPLTVFAFAGGALAIGLGFGMQTLLKNFVCGIIILFERPFRVGDILDVAGKSGVVVGIGTRSSILQLWDGTETLIPNSILLENSFTNWTYSDRKVRFIVSVGVAYGSDTRRVIQLLTEVVDRHGVVEKNPATQILLVDFGASAMTFEIRFWVDVIAANSALVSSDLRQMIAGTFSEHGISIAFPQQDIHLDSSLPIRVQVQSSTAEPKIIRTPSPIHDGVRKR